MRLYLFRRSSSGFIEIIIFDQVLNARLDRPADMVGIENLCWTIIGVCAAKAAGLLGFFVLLDNKAKRFCSLRQNKILAGNAVLSAVIFPVALGHGLFFPFFDLRILL